MICKTCKHCQARLENVAERVNGACAECYVELVTGEYVSPYHNREIGRNVRVLNTTRKRPRKGFPSTKGN